MTSSVVQEVQVSGSAATSFQSAALSSSVTAGSTLHVIGAQTSANTVTYTFTDNNQGSQVYTQLDSYWEPNNGSGLAHAYIPNHPAGSTTCTCTFSVSSTYNAAAFREIGGVSTSAPLDAHKTWTSHNSTTCNTTLTSTGGPSIISALCFISGNGTVSPTAASPQTQDVQGWSFPPGGSINGMVTSHQNLATATVNNPINFSISSASGIDLVAIGAIFDDAAAPPGPTATVAWLV